jgi:predicted metalloprotease with PDZ domain
MQQSVFSRLCGASFLALALSAVSLARASAQSQPIVLVVDTTDTPVTSIVHVRETVPVQAGPFALAYPRWVPGEHGPNGPIANLAGLTVTGGGKTIDWTRDADDMNEFHVTVPAGVASLELAYDYLGSANGTYGEARLASATMLAINWNQFLLYPQDGDITTLMVAPTPVLPGSDWVAETALPAPVRSGSRVSYAPATIERLVDSPLDAGNVFRRFMLLDAAGFTNEIDAFADRSEQLDMSATSLAGFKAIVGEMDAIYGARHWQHYHFLLTVSDVFPGNGVEHGSSSDDGNEGNALTEPTGVVGTAGLLAHEFNHSWDGKYRRPAGMAVNNFQVPERTELLWIYEGMTQFYGDLVPVRAGLWKADYYRDTLAAVYASEDHQPGRLVRPLADTAIAAPFLYRAPRTLTAERRTAGDFYVEGELLWLDVDAKLAAASGGTKSLDGFCRTFFGMENTPAMVNPYTYDQFVAALQAYQPYDWDAYFRSRVYAIAPHPPNPFEPLGWRVTYDDAPNVAMQESQMRRHSINAAFSLGLNADSMGRLTEAITGSPAAKAGLGVGDEIVAVNSRAYSPEVLMDIIKAAEHSTAPIVMIVKRNDLFRTVSIDYHGGLRYPHLTRVEGTPDGLTAIMAAHRAAPSN